jgi:hypothetical protein
MCIRDSVGSEMCIRDSNNVEASTNALPFAKRMLGEDFGFKYHLLWLIDDDKLTHINSFYEGKNCVAGQFKESENRVKKIVICNTQDEIDNEIQKFSFSKSFGCCPSFHLQILTNIYNYETIKQFI